MQQREFDDFGVDLTTSMVGDEQWQEYERRKTEHEKKLRETRAIALRCRKHIKPEVGQLYVVHNDGPRWIPGKYYWLYLIIAELKLAEGDHVFAAIHGWSGRSILFFDSTGQADDNDDGTTWWISCKSKGRMRTKLLSAR